MVFIPNACILACCEAGRLTNLFGNLRWLGECGNIGLSEPLNEGVVGLLVVGLSLWYDTLDNRRSHPVDGRRPWPSVGESVDSCSGIRNGGLVRV